MRMASLGASLALLLGGAAVALLPAPRGAEVEARVVAVSDGDTLSVRVGNAPVERVRLAEIDAPERGQPYGAASKQALSALVGGRTVRLQREGADRYGRTLARVFTDGGEVNKAMVQAGAAWAYDAYSTDPSFEAAEAEARARQAGLWALQADQITPPWDWRRRGRLVQAADRSDGRPRTPVILAEASACLPVPMCSRLSSCEAARVQLQCGATRLDSDGDGVPCEALCRG